MDRINAYQRCIKDVSKICSMCSFSADTFEAILWDNLCKQFQAPKGADT